MHFHVLHKLLENCGHVAITHDNNKLPRIANFQMTTFLFYSLKL